ncbi:MAG: glycosyltransferase family 4 protein [Deltaproteobacteria bacterium]|nr:glycosyltransferase family 4 protein [Deltaproteobacteria bacterium]
MQLVRVCALQHVMPSYRVPFFDRLGREPGIRLEVWAGERGPAVSLRSAQPTDGFGFRSIAAYRLGPFFLHPASLAAAFGGRFDVLLLGWSSRTLDLLPALGAARLCRVGTVLWGHGYSKQETPARRGLRNLIGRAGDAWLFYNHAAAEWFVAEGHPRERSFVALNALDQGPIQAARAHWLSRHPELEAFWAAHGLRPGEYVLFVSRLESDKQVDLLLHAIRRVRRLRPAVKLVLVGEGECGPLLRAQAEWLGLADAVVFAGPVWGEQELAPWFLGAAVFAFPAAIGLSILHAFGYGLPVVTSADLAGHNPEIEALGDGRNGLLYRSADVDDFARRILDLLEQPERRRRMGEEALATVGGPTGRFTLERMVQGTVQAIRFAADRAARGRRGR